MDIDIEGLEVLAKTAALNGWPFHGIAFQKAANPAVVLELVRRLKAAEEKLPGMDSLTIGDMKSSATLHGTADEVRAFHLQMRVRAHFDRQAIEAARALLAEMLQDAEEIYDGSWGKPLESTVAVKVRAFLKGGAQ